LFLVNRYILLTNNSTFSRKAGVDLELVEGGALDVLKHAKGRILSGYRLLNHPLYGNFTPNQQPYRSLLLERPTEARKGKTDQNSFRLVEVALKRYGSHIHNLPKPEDYPDTVRGDYAYLDRTLLEEPILSCCRRG
jgi:hypothetical protein